MLFNSMVTQSAAFVSQIARDLLEPIKAAHPWISYADLWTLAGAVAIEEMGGENLHCCRCAFVIQFTVRR